MFSRCYVIFNSVFVFCRNRNNRRFVLFSKIQRIFLFFLGYGTRSITANCPEAILLLIIQVNLYISFQFPKEPNEILFQVLTRNNGRCIYGRMYLYQNFKTWKQERYYYILRKSCYCYTRRKIQFHVQVRVKKIFLKISNPFLQNRKFAKLIVR